MRLFKRGPDGTEAERSMASGREYTGAERDEFMARHDQFDVS